MQNPSVHGEELNYDVPPSGQMGQMGPMEGPGNMVDAEHPAQFDFHPAEGAMHRRMYAPHHQLRGYVGEAYPAWFHHRQHMQHLGQHPMQTLCPNAHPAVEGFDGGAVGLLLNVIIVLVLIFLILKLVALI